MTGTRKSPAQEQNEVRKMYNGRAFIYGAEQEKQFIEDVQTVFELTINTQEFRDEIQYSESVWFTKYWIVSKAFDILDVDDEAPWYEHKNDSTYAWNVTDEVYEAWKNAQQY